MKIFVSLLCIIAVVSARDDLCKFHRCNNTIQLRTTEPNDFSIDQNHYFNNYTLIPVEPYIYYDQTPMYYINVSFNATQTLKTSYNLFKTVLTVENITEDPCHIGGNTCNARVLIYPAVKLVNTFTTYHSLQNNILSFEIIFDFQYAQHIENTNYSVQIEICMTGGSGSYCMLKFDDNYQIYLVGI
jgi:hypothetical protein